MKRLTAVLFFVFITFNLSAQSNYSLQLNGGIISPVNSYSGLSGGVQVAYKISDNLDLYFSTGYSKWYKNKIFYKKGYNYSEEIYDENNHRLIPFEFGAKYIFTQNKLFKTFLNAELGINYLVYDKYNVEFRINPDGEEDFYIDGKEEADAEQYLFAFGAGIGVMKELGSNINLVLGVKLKTMVNSDYNDFDLMRDLYFLSYFGFAFNL